MENWRQHFGTTLEATPDRTLLTLILSTFTEISARSHLRAILHDDQACHFEKMIAFRELTEISLDEKSAIDPFEYLPPSGDISTAEIYNVLMGLIKTCLKSTEPGWYMGGMHKLDSLLYQYLHDGVRHIVADELENQLELGDFQKSEAELQQLVELSRSVFGNLDELLDTPLFAEGSGLKIARSNIRIHAGSLELERSEAGIGSVFSITLPRKMPSMR